MAAGPLAVSAEDYKAVLDERGLTDVSKTPLTLH